MNARSTRPQTAAQLRASIRAYVVGSLFIVLACTAAWLTTANTAASFGTLPLAAVFLALAAQARKDLAALEAAPASPHH